VGRSSPHLEEMKEVQNALEGPWWDPSLAEPKVPAPKHWTLPPKPHIPCHTAGVSPRGFSPGRRSGTLSSNRLSAVPPSPGTFALLVEPAPTLVPAAQPGLRPLSPADGAASLQTLGSPTPAPWGACPPPSASYQT
jgi:hypothetical protein